MSPFVRMLTREIEVGTAIGLIVLFLVVLEYTTPLMRPWNPRVEAVVYDLVSAGSEGEAAYRHIHRLFCPALSPPRVPTFTRYQGLQHPHHYPDMCDSIEKVFDDLGIEL